MSQVSPPLRIALVASIAFLAVWMLFMRPGPAQVASAPTATAAAIAPAPADVSTPAAGTDAVAPDQAGRADAGAAAATPPAQADTGALSALPRDVASAVRRDKVIALVFWTPGAPEDRRVRGALRRANVYGDRVFVKAAPVSEIARYAPITRGVAVEQAPTVVVVDADLRAESLVGYVARTTIRQALSDALRAGA